MPVVDLPLTVDILLDRYAVDMAHARCVADLALQLFDAGAELHRLSPRARELLELGALLHNVGMTSDPEQHHIIGRDIVLGHDLADLDEDERAILACMVAFHRKKVRPALEPAYLCLGKKAQQLALRLSALLRVADGLDYSQSQTTQLVSCSVSPGVMLLSLTGPYAAGDGARAVAKADLWSKVFGSSLTATVEAEPQPVEDAPAAENGQAASSAVPPLEPDLPEQPAQAPVNGLPSAVYRLTPDLSLAEAGRTLLRRYFRRLLAEERDVRADKGPEAIHQMRVASRRLRATLTVLHEVAPPQHVRSFSKEVRRLAQAAGAVRDCDVFMAQVRSYADTLPAERRAEVQPLVDALERDRAAARVRLLDRLDTTRHAQFKRNFAAFMTDEADEWQTHLRIRDQAGSLIWRRYEALRAHETMLDFDLDLPDAEENHAAAQRQNLALHEARIDGKRLRYVLDVFEEVLGERAAPIIEPLVALQDYLGALQDIAVALAYVTALEVDDAARPGLAAYCASRQAERTGLLAGLPQRWEKLMSATYRRKVMEAIVKL